MCPQENNSLAERLDREMQLIRTRIANLEHYSFHQSKGGSGENGLVEVVDRRTGRVVRTISVDKLLDIWAQLQQDLDLIIDDGP